MKPLLLLILSAALSACSFLAGLSGPGPGIPDPGGLTPATGTLGFGMTGDVTALLSDGDAVTITIDGTALPGNTRNIAYDRNGFRAFTRLVSGDTEFGEIGHSSETSTGDMSASVATGTQNSPGGFQQAATFSRLGNSTLPTTGSAIFSGSYVGSWGTNANSTYMTYGDVSLTADFDALTISGAITNRWDFTALGAQASTYQDVTLGSAAIDAAGAFTGAATGGENDANSAGGVTDISGSWTGLIGGTTGNQVAGAVQLEKQYDNFAGGGSTPSHWETGVFLAE